MRRFSTSLSVGATGMLAGALKTVVECSDRTIVVARHASKTAKDLPGTVALDLDWRDAAVFETALVPTLDRGVDLALLWMHGSGDRSLRWLLERLKHQSCLVVHVLSSAAPDPTAFRDALNRDAAHCRYRTVRLGAIALSGGGTRWLTDDEISQGAIRAIDTETDVTAGTIPS